MHILLIEDDPRLSEYLVEALAREGNTVESCANVDEARTYMASRENETPRVIVLDRMLGRLDGATLIPEIKTRYPGAGILILSSLDMPSEKARLIDAGADEYISKPFSLEELAARLRLVARRANTGQAEAPVGGATVHVLGNLTLDLRTQNATVAGVKIDLTRKEFQLLSLLMDSPGRVYNRFQILDRVWEIERKSESNVVETAIKNLRRKFEEAKCTARIESKRNIGYWIEA
jgi:DNA-binding response OmpR family regulator